MCSLTSQKEGRWAVHIRTCLAMGTGQSPALLPEERWRGADVLPYVRFFVNSYTSKSKAPCSADGCDPHSGQGAVIHLFTCLIGFWGFL